MLSRHILRVKLMQTLFAYEQQKRANRQWALEYANAYTISADGTTEQPNEQLTAKQKKEIQQLLAMEPSKEEIKDIADPKVRTTAKKALRFYQDHSKKDLSILKKDLIVEIQKINYWYYSILGLLLAFAKVGKSYKKIDHSPFFKNRFITTLEASSKVSKWVATNSVDWSSEEGQVLSWFRDIISANPFYLEYIKAPNHDIQSQDRIIKHIVRGLIFKGTINDYFAKQDIKWFENQCIVKNMLDRTLRHFDYAKNTKIHIPKLSLDWKTERLFIKNLLENTLNIEKSKREIIAQNTKNWEVDRLPIIDRIILEMAVSEMIYCPEIPVKVTINEYIEIAKRYSTDNSPQFVNGILDTIATKLQELGDIKKSGRGLIDNK